MARLRFRRWCAALSLAGCVGLVGCQLRPQQVRVPVSLWPGYELFWLAAQEGLDRREGLHLQVLDYPDPQSIVHAYSRGELALAQLTTVEAVEVCAQVPARCPVAVLVLDESRGGDQVLARPAITALKDLRGRSVALSPSSLGPYVLSRALSGVGLTLADVQLRPMPPRQMPAALESGAVDAAAFFPPFSELARRRTSLHLLFDSSSLPGEIFDLLVVDPTFLRDHPQAVSALLRVWQRAFRLQRAEPQRVDALIARREGISLADYRDAMRGLVFFPLAEQPGLLAPRGSVARALARAHAVQRSIGSVPAGTPVPGVSALPLQQALR